jgi:hypothetical protein
MIIRDMMTHSIADDAKSKGKGKKNKERSTNGTSSSGGESKKKKARTDNDANGATETKENKGEYAPPSSDRHEPPSPPNKVT